MDIGTFVWRGNEHFVALKSHLDSKTTGEETEEEGKEDFFCEKVLL